MTTAPRASGALERLAARITALAEAPIPEGDSAEARMRRHHFADRHGSQQSRIARRRHAGTARRAASSAALHNVFKINIRPARNLTVRSGSR